MYQFITKILKNSYSRVAMLLKNKEKELHALASELLEKETLTQREIKSLLWGSQAVKEEEEAVAALKAAEDAAVLEAAAMKEARVASAAAAASGAQAATSASAAAAAASNIARPRK